MPLDQFKLDGEVAIVAGYGHCWLETLSVALYEAGATVILAASKEQISKVVAKNHFLNERTIPNPVDLLSESEILTFTDRIVSQFGKIDILVNNLNQEFAKPFLEMETNELKQVMDINFTAPFILCKTVGRHMVKHKYGKIVNILSAAAVRGLSNGTAYCSSMGAELQLTRALALEWARENVRVNAVGYGWMEDAFGAAGNDRIDRYIPMRRRGKAVDIVPLVVFLASKASSYLNGHLFFADGGLLSRA